MLSVFLRSARSAISTQFSSPQLNVSFIHKSVSRKVFLNNLHTSRPKQAAFPPVVLLLLRPVLKGIAFFAGRNFRKWWQALPKERRAKYWAKIKEKRWNLAAGSAISCGIGYWFYVEHLEKTPLTGRQRFSIVSSQQIEELSQMEFTMLCEEYAGRIVPPQHPCYSRVARIANRLLRANKDLPQIYTKNWTVTVLDDPSSINAFVLPNGNIFVFTAMLELCSSDDELGIILGHEIAHSLLGHAAENVTREHLLEGIKVFLIALAFAVLPSDIWGFLGYSLSSGVVNTVLRYPYGRLLETEADEVGLHLAAKACFDIRAAVAFWAKMHILESMKSEEPIAFLSTHPSHKVRQENITGQLPTAMATRKNCKCPDLPKFDPRDEVEAFQRSILDSKSTSRPVGIVLEVPNLATVAHRKG